MKAAVPVESKSAPMTFSGACVSGERIVIAGVGDLLFHESLQRQALTPSSSYRRFFSAVESVLKGADITYGNLEGPAAFAVAAGGGNAKDPGRVMDGRVYGTTPGALIFNYHPSAVADLRAVGFKVLSTANNHAADRGALGIDRTVDALEAAGVAYTGTRRRTATIGSLAGQWTTTADAKGVRVAWLACSYGTNGMPDRHNQVLQCYRDRETVMGEIAKAAADPSIDAVILTPHWGLEGSATPLKSDRTYARDAIEAGATAVIGAHPHVLQPWERVETASGRDGLVVYSTGNFVSNQVSAAQRSGVIALLELVKPAAGGKARISAVGFVPTWVEKNGSHGHRVVEQSGIGSELATALKSTLKLLPAANRVAASNFRSLPRECPVVPPQAPPEPLVLAAGTMLLPDLNFPQAPPLIAETHVQVVTAPAAIATLAEPPAAIVKADRPSPALPPLPRLPLLGTQGQVVLIALMALPLPARDPVRPQRVNDRMLRTRRSADRGDHDGRAQPFRDDDKSSAPLQPTQPRRQMPEIPARPVPSRKKSKTKRSPRKPATAKGSVGGKSTATKAKKALNSGRRH